MTIIWWCHVAAAGLPSIRASITARLEGWGYRVNSASPSRRSRPWRRTVSIRYGLLLTQAPTEFNLQPPMKSNRIVAKWSWRHHPKLSSTVLTPWTSWIWPLQSLRTPPPSQLQRTKTTAPMPRQCCKQVRRVSHGSWKSVPRRVGCDRPLRSWRKRIGRSLSRHLVALIEYKVRRIEVLRLCRK